MEIKTFEDAKPYIAYIMHDGNPQTSDEHMMDNTWLETRAAKYVKMISESMDADINILLNDLKNNLITLYLDDERMKSRKVFIHYFYDNPQPVYGVKISVDTYNGKLVDAEITRGYFRSEIEKLWKYVFGNWNESSEPFPPAVIHVWEGDNWKKVGNANVIDTLCFCEHINEYYRSVISSPHNESIENRIGYTVSQNGKGFSDTQILKFFTTEEEAKAYVNEWKHKKISKSQECIDEENRIKNTYGNILSLAKKLSKDELAELKELIDNIRFQKIADAKLNPLQLCYEYMDDATQIENFVIDGELRNFVDEVYDVNRYEFVEFARIFDNIMSSYPEGTTWKNIKKKDKPLIKELSEWFQGGFKGFKYDW